MNNKKDILRKRENKINDYILKKRMLTRSIKEMEDLKNEDC